MLVTEGYPNRLGALKKVADFVGCHPNVLRRWWKGTQNPPPTELVTEKRLDIVDHLNDLIYQVLRLLPDSLDEASTRELVTALGVFVDKRQLLTGGATSRNELNGTLDVTMSWRDVVEAARRDNGGVDDNS